MPDESSNPPETEQLLKTLLTDGEYSDLTLSCKGKDFHVHKAIVCSQSAFFKAAVNGHFKESITSRIELPEDDPDTIERVLVFLYLRKFNPSSNTPTKESGVLLTRYDPMTTAYNSLRVYQAADKFQIDKLKRKAMIWLQAWIEDNWSHERFPDLIDELWGCLSPGPSSLRSAIVKVISTRSRDLLKQQKMVDILEDHPGLAVDVLRRIADSKVEANAIPKEIKKPPNIEHSRIQTWVKEQRKNAGQLTENIPFWALPLALISLGIAIPSQLVKGSPELTDNYPIEWYKLSAETRPKPF